VPTYSHVNPAIAPLSPACGKMFKCPLTVGPREYPALVYDLSNILYAYGIALVPILFGAGCWNARISLADPPGLGSAVSMMRSLGCSTCHPGCIAIGGSRHVSAMFWGSDINYSRTGLAARLESMTQRNPSLAA